MNKTDIIDKLLKLAILLMRSSSEPYTKPFLELLEEKFREVDLPATTLPVLRYAPLLLKQSTLETLPFVKEFVSEIGNLNWCCSPQKPGHFSRCCMGRDELAG